MKQYDNRVHTSTKLTPIHASLRKNEGYVYHNLLDKRKKTKPKNNIGDSVWTADLQKTFFESDTTSWSYLLHINTKILTDTIPSYQIDN